MRIINKTSIIFIVLCLLLNCVYLPSFALSLSSTGEVSNAPAVNYKISGYIKPDFNYDANFSAGIPEGFKIEIPEANLTVTSAIYGYFEFDSVPKNIDGYTINIFKDNYLKRTIKNVPVTKDLRISSFESPIKIWAGDVSQNGIQDGAINLSDVIEISKRFEAMFGSPNYLNDCDFNKDGVINLIDIMITLKNFNKTTNDYPEYKVPQQINILKFGADNNYQGSKTAELLDIYGDKYTPLPEMLVKRYNPVCETVGEDCYVTGGVYYENGHYNYIKNIDVYNLKNNVWNTKGYLTVGREAPGECIFEGRLYAFGGMTESADPHITNSAETFNLNDNSSQYIANMPEGKWFPLCLENSRNIYCIGGIVREYGVNKSTGTLQIYNIDNNSWSYGPDMISDENVWGGVVSNGNIYIVQDSCVEIYDISKNKWSSIPNGISSDKSGKLLASKDKDGKLYCVFSDSIEMYNPVDNQWINISSATTVDSAFGVGIITDSK
ncbi:MAG: hypothetical protein Q8942_12980 [Bacillota bacterium]|nr:hypothetical protein [Bacillota bacterium]